MISSISLLQSSRLDLGFYLYWILVLFVLAVEIFCFLCYEPNNLLVPFIFGNLSISHDLRQGIAQGLGRCLPGKIGLGTLQLIVVIISNFETNNMYSSFLFSCFTFTLFASHCRVRNIENKNSTAITNKTKISSRKKPRSNLLDWSNEIE